ncbi:MAG: arsenic efflux protein [Candidatus Aenigmarchaeota archaeon]|nr:arsenic efflux protein [Candidatus Aenigmarchaeota archaeon]
MELIFGSLASSLKIILIVFLMMVIVDFFEIKYRKRIRSFAKGFKQYIVTSFLGVTPGCVGAFASVSMYVHGVISFGAIVAAMIATSGDESFIMLAMFPEKALVIFSVLFVLGIIFGWFTDRLIGRFRLLERVSSCRECSILIHEGEEGTPEHFLKEHVYGHVIKKHIPKLFLWLFFTMLFLGVMEEYMQLEEILPSSTLLLMLIAILVGIIPESGPHLIFTVMFAQGLIPFSVILVSSIVQDGHGMLPMLSHSVKNTFVIKLFNVGFALLTGFVLLVLGL